MRGIAGAWLAAALIAAPALGEEPFEEPAVVTTHRFAAAGVGAFDYRAEAGRVAIRDAETGVPRARMFYVAYVRAQPAGAPPRPVLFVWNGGPGAPSTTLQFEFAGPKRLDGERMVDNPETLLAHADLVFVDMVGSGFSRLARADEAPAFYGTIADTRAFAEFVRAWRATHGAEAAPTYLMGESFGSARAGQVAYLLGQAGTPVSGVVLISGGLGLPDATPPALASALHVVDLAATVRAGGKGGGEDDAATEAWARRVYAPALDRAAALPAAEREAVVARLAALTGMPPARIDARTLRFTPRAWLEATSPAATPRNAYDMRLTAEPVVAEARMVAQLRGPLGYRTSLPYWGIEPVERGFSPDGTFPEGVNARWNWATQKMTPEEVQAEYRRAAAAGDGPPRLGPPPPGTAEAMRAAPALRVLVATGLYDSYNSCAANRERVVRLPADLTPRVTFRCYPGGHMMYRDAPARRALSNDVAALLAAGE
ncbi:S10 family serine carboxypeptidase-like protein [Sphingomonas adhaesiva]|uniref:S10 family serine carboxypeptidase-like protein n=1 Tax=Sphingomonas adhaesiva TaxID=28212 RepID=UPI002FF4F7BA